MLSPRIISRATTSLSVNVYRDALLEFQRQGREAHAAMERWVSRDAGVPSDTPAVVLEGYARDLRESRERLRALFSEHGNRDDIVHALEENEYFHRKLGLSVRDKPDLEPEDEE